MNSQIFYDDVIEGQEIPPMEKPVTTINILMYLATVWLIDRIHFDHPFATQRRGLPNVVAPGNMAVDYYTQFLTGWSGEKGNLRKLSTQLRSFMIPGDTLTCRGKIIRKYIEKGNGCVELELSLKNQNGINCVPGKGVVELPMKGVK
jgi:hydroxyacyl-ACP dehydratase HTD2-like protein with hotdog domain